VSTIVRFRAPGGQYAVPVDVVSEVRSASELTPLPAPREGVVGLMQRGEDALPVLSILGSTGRHVIVIDDDPVTFGLIVEEVTGVHQMDEADIGPPPPGQDRAVVAGVVSDDLGLVLLLDVAVLTGRVAG
jgi:chemotaxis signal transduction protein